jgi:ABC-type polysaccharide/polyol phosphate export permease
MYESIPVMNNIKIMLGYHHKFLIFSILSRNLKLKYRKSYLGLLWTILIPAANALVYYFVFNKIMKVEIPNHLLFLLAGLVPWTFYSSSLNLCMESIMQNYSILSKVPIPPHVFPFSEVLTIYLNFLFSIPVLIVVQTAMVGFSFSGLIIYLLLSLILLTQAYCLGLILAYAFVFLRDLRHFLAIIIQIWFYITPIIYSPDMIPPKFSFLMYINPVAFIFDGIHKAFVFNQNINLTGVAVSLAWTLCLFLIAFSLFVKHNRRIVEHI